MPNNYISYELLTFVMYWSMSKILKIGAIFMIFLSWDTAFVVAEDDKTLNLKIGFDLTQGKNGAPSLRIRNFEEVPEASSEKFNAQKKRKRSLREGSSSGSEEAVDDKVAPQVMEPKVSDASDDADTSGSEGDRRLSTKGISPDEFEPQHNPSGRERDVMGSDSE